MLHTQKYFKAGNYMFAKPVATSNKTFRKRQHPWPDKIIKCEHWLSVAILNGGRLHGTLHRATKFQAVIWFAHIS